MSYTLAEIAEKIGAVVQGDEQCNIVSLATLASATSGQIAFLANSKYSDQLATTNASAVIVTQAEASKCQCNALVMDNPYVGYALVAQLLDTTPKPANLIHASAVIDESAIIGNDVQLALMLLLKLGLTLARALA